MLRFLLGAALGGGLIYVFSTNPEWAQRAITTLQKQGAAFGTSGEKPQPAGASSSQRARHLAGTLQDASWEELWRNMGSKDYELRAAAAAVLLDQAKIPMTAEGVELISSRYLSASANPNALRTGFSYLGLLGIHNVENARIARLCKNYVEQFPNDPVCDAALWALGELGDEEQIPYLLAVAGDRWKYCKEARERAFCCLADCGRFTPDQRTAMIPEFIRMHESTTDRQTRNWALVALRDCAPSAKCNSIDDWKRWWSEQTR